MPHDVMNIIPIIFMVVGVVLLFAPSDWLSRFAKIDKGAGGYFLRTNGLDSARTFYRIFGAILAVSSGLYILIDNFKWVANTIIWIQQYIMSIPKS